MNLVTRSRRRVGVKQADRPRRVGQGDRPSPREQALAAIQGRSTGRAARRPRAASAPAAADARRLWRRRAALVARAALAAAASAVGVAAAASRAAALAAAAAALAVVAAASAVVVAAAASAAVAAALAAAGARSAEGRIFLNNGSRMTRLGPTCSIRNWSALSRPASRRSRPS